MLVIKKAQFEAFRVPVRKKRREEIVFTAGAIDGNTIIEESEKVVIQDKKGRKSILHYSEKNLISAFTKPSGLHYQVEYDEEDRLTKLQFPGKESIQLKYEGPLPQNIKLNEAQIDLRYDSKSRLSEIIYPDKKQTKFEYTDGNHIAAITNRAGEVQSFKSIVRDGRIVHKIEDSLGRETFVMLDQMGQVQKIIFPDGTFHEISYDEELDAEITKLRNGTKKTVYYDEFHVNRVEWEDGSFLDINVKDAELVESIENEAGIISYEYDDAKRPVKESFQDKSVQYEYDEECLRKMIYPSGLEVIYEYDNDDNLQSINAGNHKLEYKYGANGTLSEIQFPNRIIEYRSNKVLEGVQEIRLISSRGDVLSNYQYKYDILGRLKESVVTENTSSFSQWKFAYDDESRLTEAKETTNNQTENFAYDRKGNIIQAGQQKIEIGKLDEVRSINGTEVLYDKGGNLTSFQDESGKSLKLEYSNNDKLKFSYTKSGTWEYWYDGLGRRIGRSNGKESHLFFWSGDKLLSEERFILGKTSTRDYIYADDNTPVAFIENDEIFWLHKDIRGAITQVFDNTGELVWKANYSAFGKANILVEKIKQPWRLTGQYFDEETRLHYNISRYYSTDLRSFLSLDPKWYLSQADNYKYAANDPYNRFDADGNWPEWLNTKNVLSVAAGIAVGVAVGVAAVALAPALGASLLGLAALGAITGLASGFTESVVNDLLDPAKDKVCWECALKSGLLGAAFGAVLGPILKLAGGLFGAVARRIAPKIAKALPKISNIIGRTLNRFKARGISKSIHDGAQGKHITTHNNYIKGKSILKSEPKSLLNDIHSGKVKSVQKINKDKIRVDFGKPIGEYVDPQTGLSSPTTKGIIHTGKKGAHIVPAKP